VLFSVDYLFLQVSVDEALVSDAQNCGNMLAAVAPFAIERGLVKAMDDEIRLAAGPKMNLGDVTDKTVPKMTMVSAPMQGGAIGTRTFVPHRYHASIGVFGAVSVATACLLEGSVAADPAVVPMGNPKALQIEHPLGETTIIAELADDDARGIG